MIFFRSCFLIILILSIASCAIRYQPASTLNITLPDPDRIRFQGKGAGAGMMLMSSMGPMGIAIGVAIDEGISKEIDGAARESGFDIKNIFGLAFQKIGSGNSVNTLTIERYGFITRFGDDDPVAAQLHVNIVRDDGSKLSVKYPDDFGKESILLTPLELIKTDGDAIIKSFEFATVAVFNHMNRLL